MRPAQFISWIAIPDLRTGTLVLVELVVSGAVAGATLAAGDTLLAIVSVSLGAVGTAAWRLWPGSASSVSGAQGLVVAVLALAWSPPVACLLITPALREGLVVRAATGRPAGARVRVARSLVGVAPALVVAAGSTALHDGGRLAATSGLSAVAAFVCASVWPATDLRRLVRREVGAQARVQRADDAWPFVHGCVAHMARELGVISGRLETAGDGDAAAAVRVQRRRIARDQSRLLWIRDRIPVAAGPHSEISDGITRPARMRLAGVRRFGVVTNTPSWWPDRLRAMWARLADPIDVVRLLHTRRSEFLALHGTLWLRAAIIASLPVFGDLTSAGVAPLGHDAAVVGTVTWLIVVSWAAALALGSPMIVGPVMRGAPSVKRVLLPVEQSMAIVLLIVAPSFAAAAFAVGPLNWVQRPVWRVRYLFGLGALNLGALALGLAANDPAAGVPADTAEVVLGAVLLVVIGSSYGLMLPFTLYWLVTAPARLVAQRGRRARVLEARARRMAAAAAAETEATVATAAVPDAERAHLLNSLRQARRVLASDAMAGSSRPRRRSRVRSAFHGRRTLAELVGEAVLDIVPPVGTEPGSRLHARLPAFAPRDLSSARLDRRDGRTLSILIRLIAFEALRHGEGTLLTRCRSADGVVRLELVNPRAGGSPSEGFGTGGRILLAACRDMPGLAVAQRGMTDGRSFGLREGREVHVVAVTFPVSRLRPAAIIL